MISRESRNFLDPRYKRIQLSSRNERAKIGFRKFNRILSKAEKHEVNQEIHDMLSEEQFSMPKHKTTHGEKLAYTQ